MHFVEKKSGNCVVLTVKGNLVSTDDTEKLHERIKGILANGTGNVVVDLKNINIISSLGIGGLIRCLRVVRENNGDMRLAGISDRVRRVLQITKLDGIIRSFDTRDEAIKSFDESAP